MSPDQKREFVVQLCNSVMQTVLDKVVYMPDAWDGMELREYVAEKFDDACYLRKQPNANRKRLHSYRNDCVVLPL
jgi:hypothetical protein